ncbi:4Fe-4S dicluster domain-containing protein [Thermodesulfitimonas autotrophica]|uniref:4Fe-4S dicluster domain-containing protein n=1 Tax=Thermodesulfitimonas autotrophica TaxID=1894989 RepID=UPI002FE3434F
MNQVFVRPEHCLGCRSCEIACAVQHSQSKTLFGAVLEEPRPQKRVFVEAAGSFRMPVVCRHCEDAPCLAACIAGCLYRDEKGFVRRKKERCIGCWSCIMACPFGVVTRDRHKQIAVKCDRCHKLEVPACVAACPTKALFLADVDAFPKERRKQLVLREAEGV